MNYELRVTSYLVAEVRSILEVTIWSYELRITSYLVAEVRSILEVTI